VNGLSVNESTVLNRTLATGQSYLLDVSNAKLRGTFLRTRTGEGGFVAAEPVFSELSGEDAG